MLSRLKQHPFAVKATLDYSLTVTYALPAARLQALLPPLLSVDSWEEETGFVAVAMVHTSGLRPATFPSWTGQNFFLIGYRIFVRYTNRAGRNLRGLYILRSSTNSAAMKVLGGLFTAYHYDRIDVSAQPTRDRLLIRSLADDLDIGVARTKADTNLPETSPFPDWKAARRFAGPLPFTFSWNPPRREMLIVQGSREHWTPQPMTILHQHAGALDEFGLESAVPASAFLVEHVAYQWQKGTVERWP